MKTPLWFIGNIHGDWSWMRKRESVGAKPTFFKNVRIYIQKNHKLFIIIKKYNIYFELSIEMSVLNYII